MFRKQNNLFYTYKKLTTFHLPCTDQVWARPTFYPVFTGYFSRGSEAGS